ncbi:hypothetical protein K431DRAFT_295166 [Polychaeton citri CBS 116435]|uniref:Uncharacterized protein n=1 Tax=Polychaeton citri CBS 116435 TaxID=1314669 RepID=A0A9P4Q650_9PEZI|nr:hypothetical protein K431DRAFT_295166 [Polychaeton citri CBS 116435]
MAEEDILVQILSLSDKLSRASTEELMPFSAQVSLLSKLYCNLEQKIQHQGHEYPAEEPTTDAGPVENEERTKWARHRADLNNLLRYSIDHIPHIKEAIWNFKQPLANDLCFTARAIHLQNVLTLQKRRLSIPAGSPERVLTICARMSLAKDFYLFELQGGWRPKQAILDERIRTKQDLAVQ